jgi:hypothetical protein
MQIIRITITILDVIHRPVFDLKHKVSETGFRLRLQVEPKSVGPEDGDRIPARTVIVILIYIVTNL